MYISNAKLTNLWETAVSLYCFLHCRYSLAALRRGMYAPLRYAPRNVHPPARTSTPITQSELHFYLESRQILPSSSSILTSDSSIIILKRTIVDEKGKQNIHSYNLPLPETLQKLQNRKNLHIIHLTSVFVERHDNQVFPTRGKRVSHQWEKSFPRVGKPCSACLV